MAPFVFPHVIASEAKQSQPQAHERLAEIASSRFALLAMTLTVIASEAKQSRPTKLAEIASSRCALLAMTVNSRSYFPACAFSAARSASLRKLITATLLVRE
jgi:hypothetical protein